MLTVSAAVTINLLLI